MPLLTGFLPIRLSGPAPVVNLFCLLSGFQGSVSEDFEQAPLPADSGRIAHSESRYDQFVKIMLGQQNMINGILQQQQSDRQLAFQMMQEQQRHTTSLFQQVFQRLDARSTPPEHVESPINEAKNMATAAQCLASMGTGTMSTESSPPSVSPSSSSSSSS